MGVVVLLRLDVLQQLRVVALHDGLKRIHVLIVDSKHLVLHDQDLLFQLLDLLFVVTQSLSRVYNHVLVK